VVKANLISFPEAAQMDLSSLLLRDTLCKENNSQHSFQVEVAMSEQWRILVVEDDERLNQNIVNTLSIDGYVVKGTTSGSAVIRILWTEEYDVIIGDLTTPGAAGLELLQWLRTYRPDTRMIMVASTSGSHKTRTQALEAGAVSYLEKPLNLHILKEELRRLLQQTGFSANLDSFDLLDVIQIITMSRKNIALLINTGLEERGVLYFQNGELIWAEYGILHGEEAFFALAAHKNGTVIHQPWHDRITPNVTQPLARLIFQALQYRTKYASLPQSTGEHAPVPRTPLQLTESENDDSPFQVLTEKPIESVSIAATPSDFEEITQQNMKEWWQQTGKFSTNGNGQRRNTHQIDQLHEEAGDASPLEHSPVQDQVASATSSTNQKMPTGERTDLPSWVTEQPTRSDMPKLRPSSLSNTVQSPSVIPLKPSPAEGQPGTPLARTTDPLPRGHMLSSQKSAPRHSAIGARIRPGEAAPNLNSASPVSRPQTNEVPLAHLQKSEKRNYSTLVAALQTLGYSITGFIAAAVADLDGQPIAQVAIEELDIAPMCKHFSTVLQSALVSFQEQQWEAYENMIIASADRYVLLRLIGNKQEAFQVLVTTHQSEPAESLEIMSDVDGALAAALS
jgi:DNA-binding response OmpR family regulator/predicted regulator of Ras-like GTPase activity (Roadblock/LC7/MglB family)